jgi:hypothetical protein
MKPIMGLSGDKLVGAVTCIVPDVFVVTKENV